MFANLVNDLLYYWGYGRYSTGLASSWTDWPSGYHWNSQSWSSWNSWLTDYYSSSGSRYWYTCSSGYYISTNNATWDTLWGVGRGVTSDRLSNSVFLYFIDWYAWGSGYYSGLYDHYCTIISDN